MPKYNVLIQNLEKPINNTFIYGLIDPDTKELRYIGQTRQGFSRITEHYYKCTKVNRTTKLFSASKLWIKKLKESNKIFEVIYLDYCLEKELNELEIFWIGYFKYIGCRLLNHESGGNREILSDETRKSISDRTKKAMDNPDTKRKLRENGLKLGGFNKGKKFDQSFKDKISKAQENNVIYLQDENGNIYRGLKKAAEGLGCTISAINHHVSGRCKTVRGQKLKRL